MSRTAKVVRWLGQRRKWVLGTLGVIVAWGPAAQIDGFRARDWWGLAAGLLGGSVGVHAVANDPAPPALPPESDRLHPQPPPPVVADVGSPGD